MLSRDEVFLKMTKKTCPLSSVRLSLDQEEIVFKFQDNTEYVFGVEGDCCSYSWIEHLEMPLDINGAMLLSVNYSAPITSDHIDHDDNGEISVYNTVFRTNHGDITLEFRNSSNGYYGGY